MPWLNHPNHRCLTCRAPISREIFVSGWRNSEVNKGKGRWVWLVISNRRVTCISCNAGGRKERNACLLCASRSDPFNNSSPFIHRDGCGHWNAGQYPFSWFSALESKIRKAVSDAISVGIDNWFRKSEVAPISKIQISPSDLIPPTADLKRISEAISWRISNGELDVGKMGLNGLNSNYLLRLDPVVCAFYFALTPIYFGCVIRRTQELLGLSSFSWAWEHSSNTKWTLKMDGRYIDEIHSEMSPWEFGPAVFKALRLC